MYAQDSTSSVTNAEWINIHLLSDVQVMMPSIQAAISGQSLHELRTAACDIGHCQMRKIGNHFAGLGGESSSGWLDFSSWSALTLRRPWREAVLSRLLTSAIP